MSWVKTNQRTVALVLGYFLVASLFYNLGQYRVRTSPPEITVSEPEIDLSHIYNNANQAVPQFGSGQGSVAGQSQALDCAGKIKGNISSSGKIYHLPGGSFYNRTNPEMCFDTEAQAQAAGFRKSQR